jgi:hypothetical protein
MADQIAEQKEKLKPPMGGLTAFSDFFELCERRNIDHIDIPFLRANNISSQGNETKVISGLKFLGLFDEDGTATSKMKSLNVQGEQYKKNLANIVQEAYDILFKTVKNFENAKSEDIINCFRVDYKMSPQTANEAYKIFTYLAKRAEIPISSEMSEGVITPAKSKKGTKQPTKEKKKEKNEENESLTPNSKVLNQSTNNPDETVKIEYQNKVLMFLPKGNKEIRTQAAKLARQFIDIYENDDTN